MRVAYLCRVLWNGGVQRTAIAATEGLQALGYDVELIFLRRTSDANYSLPRGTIVTEAPANSSPITRAQQAITSLFAGHRGIDATVDLDRLWAVRDLVAEFDVVIYNDQYASLLGIWNYIWGRRPYVMMLHEFYPKVASGWMSFLLNPFADLLDWFCILLAPAVVTTSVKTLNRLDRVVPGRSVLARLGSPTVSAPIPDSSIRDRRTVLSITVWDRGRHPEMYVALAQCCPEFHFILAGIWADRHHFESVKSEASGVPNLTITGPITEDERQRIQDRALLYLRYGFDEAGPGMGGLEALAKGSIVICNRGLGLSEIIEDGKSGFILNAADVAETATLFRKIDCLSDEQISQISAAARQVAQTNSWEAHCRVLAEAIQHAYLRRRFKWRRNHSKDKPPPIDLPRSTK